MRSFLFVPADSERKLAKGPLSGPDGLILDLEDSVAADRKKVARDMALAYLRGANRTGPKLYVRVNALDTGLTLGDLAVVMQGRPDGIVFPKCVGQANLDLLANYLDALEAREGIAAGATRILTIATESAAAVLALTAAPARHARLVGHSWGGEDLMADLGALAKGPLSGPDGLILDLEDSVAADRKKVARDMALAYLRGANRAGPKLYVRVNALDTGLTLGDLAVVMQGRPDGIVFPKCVGQANLDLLANYLDA
ncbi:MAG TPA: aldolase/citrate lyase family protein, partial [Reyranella sp.]|nr:aldolase/citrate lyase family protein [Reyranella sp.]